MSRDLPAPEGRAASSEGLIGAARGAWRNPVVRLITGLAISAVFLAITVSRVDLGETAHALAGAAIAGVLLAIATNLVELTIRAERWRVLLHPSGNVPLRSAFAYLMIGYFANAVLPARLGDPARAYLAGRAFRISSLTASGFGTSRTSTPRLTISWVHLSGKR